MLPSYRTFINLSISLKRRYPDNSPYTDVQRSSLSSKVVVAVRLSPLNANNNFRFKIAYYHSASSTLEAKLHYRFSNQLIEIKENSLKNGVPTAEFKSLSVRRDQTNIVYHTAEYSKMPLDASGCYSIFAWEEKSSAF